MFLFSNESAFRRWCYNIVNSQLFEYLVILAIVVSSVQLALENPLEDPESLVHDSVVLGGHGDDCNFLCRDAAEDRCLRISSELKKTHT